MGHVHETGSDDDGRRSGRVWLSVLGGEGMTETTPYEFYTDDSRFKIKIVKYLLRSILKSEHSLNQCKSATIHVKISYPNANDRLKELNREWRKACMPIYIKIFTVVMIFVVIMLTIPIMKFIITGSL